MGYLVEEYPKYFNHRHEAKRNHAAEEAKLIAARLIRDVKQNLLFKNSMLALISRDIYIQLGLYDEVVPGFIYDINKHNKSLAAKGSSESKIEGVCEKIKSAQDKMQKDERAQSKALDCEARWSEFKITVVSNHYLAKIQDPIFHFLEKNIKKNHLFLFGDAVRNFIHYVSVEKKLAVYQNPLFWKTVADDLRIDISSVSAMSAYTH